MAVNKQSEKQISRDFKKSKQEMVDDRESPQFKNPSNSKTQSANLSDLSKISTDDQATIRRKFSQEKLQTRNQNSQDKLAGQNQSVADSQSDDNSIKGRWQKLKNSVKKVKNQSVSEVGGVSKSQAEKLANQTIKEAWMYGHEIVEEALIANFYLLPILGPIYLIIVILRPLIAMFGLLTIKIKGVKVKMVPGYGLNGLLLRAKGVAIILIITSLEWIMIIVLAYVYEHPLDAAWEFLKGLWDLVASYK